jgi:hypothetical protein
VKRIVAELQRRNYLVWFDLERMKVSTNGLFEPFLSKNEQFTKTGSGQT